RPFLGPFFRLYFNQVVPIIGWLLTRDYKAYKYLPDSVRQFPTADSLADMYREAGLQDVKYQLLGFGAVAMHVGIKPCRTNGHDRIHLGHPPLVGGFSKPS